MASGAGLEPGAPRIMPKHSCGDALGYGLAARHTLAARLQIDLVEAFAEPVAVPRRGSPYAAAVLVVLCEPQAAEADGRPQFQRFRPLLSGDGEGLLEARLGGRRLHMRVAERTWPGPPLHQEEFPSPAVDPRLSRSGRNSSPSVAQPLLQFVAGQCGPEKLTKAPFLGLLAMAGFHAADSISAACAPAVIWRTWQGNCQGKTCRGEYA